MPRGGKRPGAGRKPGGQSAKTRAKRARAAVAEVAGITPLEVMLDVMRRHHKGKKYDKAAAIARDAAPYVHPRLSAVQHGGSGGPAAIVQVIVGVSEADLLGTNGK